MNPARKPDGQVQICVDSRCLNDNTQANSFICRFKKKSWMTSARAVLSKLDLNKAFTRSVVICSSNGTSHLDHLKEGARHSGEGEILTATPRKFE